MTSYRAVIFLPSLLFRYIQSRRLWKSYQEVCCRELPKNYIFFPWSFQPERTTDPEAGRFADLEFCVHYLMAELPAEWTLVIKEHPRQFDGKSVDIRKIHARPRNIYERISRIERVVIADLTIDSHVLAEGSIACVTTTGSIGIEVLEMGKKIGCFGLPWYAGMRGCYVIDTPLKLRSFYSSLQSESNELTITKFPDRIQRYLSKHAFLMPNKQSVFDDFSPVEMAQMAAHLASALNAKKISSIVDEGL